LKKSVITAGGILGGVIILFKIISFISTYDKLFNAPPQQRIIADIAQQSEALTTAQGYYFNDSVQQWVINNNIIAPKETNSPDSGVNFCKVNTAKFIEDGYTYYALISTSKGHNTNSRRVLDIFPPLNIYNCDIVVFSALSYQTLRNYISDTGSYILSLKGLGQSTTHNKQNAFTQEDYKRTISFIFYDKFWGIKEESNQGSVILQSRGANFLVQKVKEKKEWKVRFLLPDIKAPGNLRDKKILTKKYFECPLDSFKKLIIP
jgi:hypothetical protein